MVHSLKIDSGVKRFCDYAEKKVIPFIKSQLATADVDVIWDRYLSNSIKATARENMGAGVRRRLPSGGNGKLPKNWKSYLHNIGAGTG